MASPAIVALPAHDEADGIARVLESLGAQSGYDRVRRLPVLLFANNCRDGTARVANEFAATPAGAALDLTVVTADLPASLAHVGTARRRAMDLAAEAVGPLGVLLSTDADARLPPDWVAANLAALEEAEIVGGRLVIDSAADDPRMTALHARIEDYWARVRNVEDRLDPPPHDPAPRHGDHTGASLALRVATYRAVGGLPPLPRGEDNALVARVVEAGGRLRHDPAVSVWVSDRGVGRAEGGMATDMARRQAVVDGLAEYLLPAPAHWRHVVARRAGLRAAWCDGPDAAETALRRSGLPDEGIAAVDARTCPNDIAFVARAHRQLEKLDEPAPLLPLEAALAAFEPSPALA